MESIFHISSLCYNCFSDISGVNYMDIGKRIVEIRKQRGWSQYRLYNKANIGQATLSQIESGLKSPNVVTLQKICDALSITLSDFFTEKEPELNPELRLLLETAKKLSPKQTEQLQKLLETMSKE